MIILYHLIAATIGLIFDKIIGDPPKWPHPVRWIGQLIATLTRRLNKGANKTAKGVLLTLLVVGLTAGIVLALSIVTYELHWTIYIAFQALLIGIGLAQNSLEQAALDVYEPLEKGDLQLAREKLSWIVGRDTANLDEANITRGVIETVSENTSDGVTAPLFYSFLFGATGLWAYKAINTLDSMVGYKNERFLEFGRCAAKLDDVVNFLPSRMTGFLILSCSENTYKLAYKERFKNWLRDAKKHPSPNSGYLESATAYQLGIQLGGLNYYEGVASHRAEMGQAHMVLQAKHIKNAILQMKVSTFYFWAIMMILGGVIFYVTETWS